MVSQWFDDAIRSNQHMTSFLTENHYKVEVAIDQIGLGLSQTRLRQQQRKLGLIYDLGSHPKQSMV